MLPGVVSGWSHRKRESNQTPERALQIGRNVADGSRVTRFGITDRFGTRWSLAAIPFGSYIKMIDKEQSSTSASAIARAEIGNKSESLSSRSRVQRAAIYGAGSAANILFGQAK